MESISRHVSAMVIHLIVDENTVFVLGKSQDKNVFSVIFSK